MTHKELVLHTRNVAQAVTRAKCFCGKRKFKSLPFCRECYGSLPEGFRDALNLSLYCLGGAFENGLLQAYDAAKEWLEQRSSD